MLEKNNRDESLRIFLHTLLYSYTEARTDMGIPLDDKSLRTTINNLKISFEPKGKSQTKRTFKSTPSKLTVIAENFDNNDTKKNIYLMFNELTHLSNPLHNEIIQNRDSLEDKYEKMLDSKNNDHLSSYDVFMGTTAVDNVMAQWCAEKCDDYIIKQTKEEKKRNTRKRKLVTSTIMGENITTSTDFSNRYFYHPLQHYIEHLSSRLGYESFDSFASTILTGEKSFNDLITPDTVEQLGYIGLLCEGIYYDNNINDDDKEKRIDNYTKVALHKSSIPIAIDYLDNLKNQETISIEQQTR